MGQAVQYSSLDLNARSLLGFHTPFGSRITLSSFVRPKFGTSYSIGIKDGWIAYLYSSQPLPPATVSSSDSISLRHLLRCYRPLATHAPRHEVGHALVYGRLYLPQSRLEALLSTRVHPAVQLTLRAVSQERLRHGGTLLALAAWDDQPRGRFGVEALASSDGGVLGLRGLWNATNPPPPLPATGGAPPPTPLLPGDGDKERINGRFSVGGEIYYGLLNKSGGMSLGGRFQTLPTHHGTPLTATLTCNLLGHVSATYAVVAGDCTLASQFGFNVYSYESDWAVGIELWDTRRPRRAAATTTTTTTTAAIDGEARKEEEEERPSPTASKEVSLVKKIKERSFQAKLEWRLDNDDDHDDEAAAAVVATDADLTVPNSPEKAESDLPAGVLKCRCDQHMRIGLVYEGRYKSLLFSLGTDVDPRKLDAPFRTVGLEVQFSS